MTSFHILSWSLFYDSVSISDCTALNSRVTGEYQIEKDLEGCIHDPVKASAWKGCGKS
jgi:hypothetical protein